MRAVLYGVAHGTRVVLLLTEDEVTPAGTAKLFGVTRQFVDRPCEDGVLPVRRLPGSRHRCVRLQDVPDVAAEHESRRSGGEALRAAVVAAGLGKD